MRRIALIFVTVTLAACGGGRSNGGYGGSPVRIAATATGPISRACLEANRAAATPQLCGCIQAVADVTLSGSEQRRAARFFSDPDDAQETRARDDAGTEAFWQRYKDFSDAARMQCS